jgi:hypothetical protein
MLTFHPALPHLGMIIATWTIVLTKPDGTSCVVAAGKHWQNLPTTSFGPEA